MVVNPDFLRDLKERILQSAMKTGGMTRGLEAARKRYIARYLPLATVSFGY